MQTSLGHLELLVAPVNLPFYRDLFAFLGWKTIFENEEMLGTGGTGDAKEGSLWFVAHVKEGVTNDYDGPGVNHVGIQAGSVADVDSTVTYLQDSGVSALFETPRHRPEFSQGPESTYYQVMFESPDRILFEVLYTGPK